MDDLISRQAAIDGLEGYIDDKGIFNQDRWFVHGIRTAITHLQGMPTAQPDSEYISQQAVTESDLIDWYINSVDESEPVWTEEHVYELFNDFYLIPKENR